MRALESRRTPRFPIQLWVKIDGIDSASMRRTGDISAHGIFFATEAVVGEVGCIHWLTLESRSKRHRFQVMAHVVRSFAVGLGEHGVALEFMPESEERMEALHRFVAVLVAERDPRPSVPSVRSVGSVVTPPAPAGTLSFKTRWRASQGEAVRVEISAPGVPLPISFRGTVASVRGSGVGPSDPFQIEVALLQDRDGPLRRLSSTSFPAVTANPPPARSPLASVPEDDLSRSVDDLIRLATNDPSAQPSPRVAHLSGVLTAGRLPMLASLFEMEGISGELTLAKGGERAKVFVRLGRIIDVEPSGSGTIHETLARLFEWSEGTFEFAIREVERPDRVASTITALLLEIARLTDEAQRDRAP